MIFMTLVGFRNLCAFIYYRFESFSGKLNEDIFNKNYSFLDDYQKDEMIKLKSTLKKIKDDGVKEQISKEIQKYDKYR